MNQVLNYKWLIVSLLLLFGSSLCAQNNPIAEEKYVGKIKHVSEYYEEKATATGKDLKMQLDYFFNEIGQIVREVKGVFTYNYLYEENGNQILLTVFEGADSTGFISYIYNEKNLLIEEKNNSGQFGSFKYNPQGKILSVMNYDKNGALTTRGNYSYNDEGFCIEEKWYIASGFSERLTDLYKYQHDEAGNLTHLFHETYDIYFHGEGYTILTEYDSLNRWVAYIKLTDDNEFIWRETATYDAMGNQVSLIGFNEMGEPIETTIHIFKYDLIGNWLEKKTFVNEKLTVTRKREIEYYLE